MRTVIVIPTYNEATNIQNLVKSIFKATNNAVDLLFVDDNSPDGTAEIIKGMSKENDSIRLLERPRKLGLGTAYVAGFKYAIREKYDLIFEMDADLSHNPADVPRIISAMENYDLVIGSRYLTGVNVINWPLSRLILSLWANWYTRKITGLPLQDCTAGFKCFRREVLENIDLDRIRSDGYSFQIELHYFAWKRNYRIKELPIIFTDRESGSSKMSRKVMVEAAFMVWRLKFHDWFSKDVKGTAK
ncbi:MAG: polyprenol monophosphomannose synthase [Deferribacteres bacterium]|nr:polyprenol monophosphomannose synthase [candidate division KSB1 bacterium]MCB9502246.1 polyprenol monophosphomannose synthase [Deferribacteres bacterium]